MNHIYELMLLVKCLFAYHIYLIANLPLVLCGDLCNKTRSLRPLSARGENIPLVSSSVPYFSGRRHSVQELSSVALNECHGHSVAERLMATKKDLM